MTNMRDGAKRVFLVEDEFLILMFLDSVLTRMGYEVAAKAASLDQGFAALSNSKDFDIAILDVNLNGSLSYQLADQLKAADVPVLFSTGYGRNGLADNYKDWPVIQKPYSEPELRKALATLLN